MNEALRILAADSEGLDAAIAALRSGEPVVLPTDTVHGLAVIAGDSAALERVFELKRRPAERSIAVLVASVDQAETLVEFSDAERRLGHAFWPGALTIIAHRRPDADPSIGRSDGTVGVRCPNEAFVRSLAERLGPLATTSANLSGESTPATALEAAVALVGNVALVIDDGERNGSASTVVRVRDGGFEIVREGAIGGSQLAAELGPGTTARNSCQE